MALAGLGVADHFVRRGAIDLEPDGAGDHTRFLCHDVLPTPVGVEALEATVESEPT